MTAEGLHPRAPKWSPAERKRWPNFLPEEFDCKGTGKYFHNPELLDYVQTLRTRVGRPFSINSAYRDPEHNRRVGGATKSQHLLGNAVDIALEGHDRKQLLRMAIDLGAKGIGFGRTFLHVDLRPGPQKVFTYPGGLGPWISALGFNPMLRFNGDLRSLL
jgi:zinc D-Ala-D-Ala carboxypeptidase